MSTSIWRYLDFAKFAAMLDHRDLYLPRADMLGDPLEGSITARDVEAYKAFLKEHRIEGESCDLLRTFLVRQRAWTYISCWHMSEHESVAMWRLYGQTSKAVAIRTTYGRLRKALAAKFVIGAVKYTDYDTGVAFDGNPTTPFFRKHVSFAHEREVRAVRSDLPTRPNPDPIQQAQGVSVVDLGKDGPHGIWGGIADLGELIAKVYVAPASEGWFEETVRSTVQRFGYSFDVQRTDLERGPLF